MMLDGRDIRVAARFRRASHADHYQLYFTPRSQVNYGATTVLVKTVNGESDWMFYGNARPDGYGIGSRWLIDLGAFRAALIRNSANGFPLRWGESANYDGTRFSRFDIRSFPPEASLVVVSGRTIRLRPSSRLGTLVWRPPSAQACWGTGPSGGWRQIKDEGDERRHARFHEMTAQWTDDENAIMATLDEYAAAYCAKRVDRLMSIFAEGQDISLIGTGSDELCAGRAAISKVFERNFGEATARSFEWGWRHVTVCGNSAVVAISLTIHLLVDGAERSVPIRWSVSLVRSGSDWKWVNRHASVPAGSQKPGNAYPTFEA